MARGSVAAAAAAIGVLAGVVAGAGLAAAEPRPSLAQPAVSPDGKEIAFVSGGDIWTVPSTGGVAHLLVSNPATDSRPLYSPDGTRLAFQSTRDGPNSIYVLTLATGKVSRVTWSDTGETLDGWSPDGTWIYFTSTRNDVQRQGDIFRVRAAGGTPLEVSAQTYLNEFESAPSPDGQTLALVARGISNQQWWRHGHSHIDETEVWLKPVDGGAYRRLLPADAKHAWPMWSRDGAALYLMSDQDGNENLWRVPVGGGAPVELTRFHDGRVLWPSIGGGDLIAFERNFGVWTYDPATGKAAALPITLRGAPAAPGERHAVETSFSEMSVSPDGRKVAFTTHGQIFAASTKDGGPAQRLTRTPGAARRIVWSPDSRRIAFVAEQGVDTQIEEYDFATGQSRRLAAGKGALDAPAYAPDGKRLAYLADEREVRILDLAGERQDRVAFSGRIESLDPVWSPDSRWVAFAASDPKAFGNLWVADTRGGEARPISFLGNGEILGAAWTPDGKSIYLSSAQRSEAPTLVRIDLVPRATRFREDVFHDLFKPGEPPPASKPATTDTAVPDRKTTDAPAGKPADGDEAKAGKPSRPPEPVRILFDGLRQRAVPLPIGLPAEDPHITPDGKTLVFRARVAGQDNLYSYDLDPLAKEPPTARQLTSTAKRKADIAFTPDSKEVFYLEGGVVTSTPLDTPRPKPVAIAADLTIDFDSEKRAVFDEAWSTLNKRYFDASFHGRDWGALREAWTPYIEGAATPDELRRDINLLIGELDASHSGINGGGAPALRDGDLGLRFERGAYEAGKGLVVREVIALGPAAIEGSIKRGDVLLAVNGQALAPEVNLDRLLLDQIDRRTVLSVATPGAPPREVVVRPVSAAAASALVYRQWVEGRRAYVDRISGGKLGYAHMADMSDGSLAQLYLDLDAENQGKQGVVIDIRNNNGGYVNGYALDVLTRRNYLVMTPRDGVPVPSRQALGQRALGLPTVLVVNESSLSDAEDFTEGYRALGLGKVVGVPTAGWIIFTGGRELIDGSVVRVPGTRIQTTSGEDMEGHSRPVDITVERPLGESETGHDAQLEAAVAVLLKGG